MTSLPPHIPIPLLVFGANILCRVFVCKGPYPLPQIVHENYKENFIAGENFFDTKFATEPNLIETGYGDLEGYYMTTSEGRKIGAFEGIAYAEKAERWEKAEPARPWKGVLQAKRPGPDCLQLNVRRYLKIYGKEHCQFLNVYTPVISGKKKRAKLPVVIYIHGGSFLFGAGRDHGPSYLLNDDIVLVNFNYRLGVLGFMSTADKVLPGNLGLKDQVLAIKWVKDNIEDFGGDPNQITLWGYSAGAVSVHLHMMSNQTKHLFHRAISNSGTAMCHWGVHEPRRARSFTEKLAKYFKCPTKDSEELVNCLKKINPVALVAAQVHLMGWGPFPPALFVPTAEQDYGDQEIFLSDMPDTLYKNGEVSAKPWIVSTTEHEGLSTILVLELLRLWAITKLYWNRVAKTVIDLDYMDLQTEFKDEVVDKVTKYYLGNKLSSAGTVHEYSNLLTDRLFHFSIVKSLQAHYQLAPTYAYYFSFSNGSYNLGNINLHESYEWGAGHGEDESYFFNATDFSPGFYISDPEYKLSKLMLNFATNFVRNGTPTFTSELGETLNLWEPVTNPKNISMLLLDKEVKMIIPNLKRVKFWNDLKLPDFKLLVAL